MKECKDCTFYEVINDEDIEPLGYCRGHIVMGTEPACGLFEEALLPVGRQGPISEVQNTSVGGLARVCGADAIGDNDFVTKGQVLSELLHAKSYRVGFIAGFIIGAIMATEVVIFVSRFTH